MPEQLYTNIFIVDIQQTFRKVNVQSIATFPGKKLYII